MTHIRLWQFEVAGEQEDRFVEAYGADGTWAKLFETAQGFIRTELWRGPGGIFLTVDRWRTVDDFTRFQAARGDDYRILDSELEGLAISETFLGAFDSADDQSRSGAP